MSTIEAGPTQERLKQADGHVSVGGENKQRRYTFRDEVLTRAYEPLIRSGEDGPAPDPLLHKVH